MATEDRNGALHSERNGQFVSKDKSDEEKIREAERVYNTHGHLNETEKEPVPLDKGKKAWKDPEFDVAPNILKTENPDDNKEYRAKFNLMSNDSNVAQKYYEIAQEILKHRGGTNGEDIYVYDTVSGEVRKGTSGEVAYHPEYSDELSNWIAERRGRLVAFHNHAKSSPPSIDDLKSALHRGYAKGYVVCHNGKIYEYTAPNPPIGERKFSMLYLECKSNDETEKIMYAYSKLMENPDYNFSVKEITNG